MHCVIKQGRTCVQMTLVDDVESPQHRYISCPVSKCNFHGGCSSLNVSYIPCFILISSYIRLVMRLSNHIKDALVLIFSLIVTSSKPWKQNGS